MNEAREQNMMSLSDAVCSVLENCELSILDDCNRFTSALLDVSDCNDREVRMLCMHLSDKMLHELVSSIGHDSAYSAEALEMTAQKVAIMFATEKFVDAELANTTMAHVAEGLNRFLKKGEREASAGGHKLPDEDAIGVSFEELDINNHHVSTSMMDACEGVVDGRVANSQDSLFGQKASTELGTSQHGMESSTSHSSNQAKNNASKLAIVALAIVCFLLLALIGSIDASGYDDSVSDYDSGDSDYDDSVSDYWPKDTTASRGMWMDEVTKTGDDGSPYYFLFITNETDEVVDISAEVSGAPLSDEASSSIFSRSSVAPGETVYIPASCIDGSLESGNDGFISRITYKPSASGALSLEGRYEVEELNVGVGILEARITNTSDEVLVFYPSAYAYERGCKYSNTGMWATAWEEKIEYTLYPEEDVVIDFSPDPNSTIDWSNLLREYYLTGFAHD